MTKRTSKTSQPKKPRAKATKAKVGGARPGSGPKPKLGVGAVRSVIKTVRLSAGEHDAQLAAVVRAGAKDWAEWARPILNAAAGSCPVDHGHGKTIAALADGVVDAGGTLPYGGTMSASASPVPAETPIAAAQDEIAQPG